MKQNGRLKRVLAWDGLWLSVARMELLFFVLFVDLYKKLADVWCLKRMSKKARKRRTLNSLSEAGFNVRPATIKTHSNYFFFFFFGMEFDMNMCKIMLCLRQTNHDGMLWMLKIIIAITFDTHQKGEKSLCLALAVEWAFDFN